MGMRYSVSTTGVSVSAAQDVFELTAPSDAAVVIHRIEITDETSETSEQAVATLNRGIGATSGSGGTTPTPAKLETGFAAAGSTVEANNTTQMSAGGGSVTRIQAQGFNWLNGLLYAPTPEERIVLSPSEKFTVAISAPGASRTVSAYMVFEEIGG